MNFQSVLALEYSAQHFGFHPRTFTDNLFNVYFENICEALTNLKQILSEECRELVPVDQIQFATDALLKNFVENLNKVFDKLEVFLNVNVFSIPNDVLLSEDEIHMQVNCSKEDEEKLDAEIADLERRIIEEKKKKAVFEAKTKEQNCVQIYLLDIQKWILSILNAVSEENISEKTIKVQELLCSEILSTIEENNRKDECD